MARLGARSIEEVLKTASSITPQTSAVHSRLNLGVTITKRSYMYVHHVVFPSRMGSFKHVSLISSLIFLEPHHQLRRSCHSSQCRPRAAPTHAPPRNAPPRFPRTGNQPHLPLRRFPPPSHQRWYPSLGLHHDRSGVSSECKSHRGVRENPIQHRAFLYRLECS